MTEPTITCPNCKTEIKLTESLAAPLLAATQQDFDKRLAQKDADIGKRESTLPPRANMTCYTYPREISEQRGRYDDQPADKGPDARSEGFFRSRCIAGSP